MRFTIGRVTRALALGLCLASRVGSAPAPPPAENPATNLPPILLHAPPDTQAREAVAAAERGLAAAHAAVAQATSAVAAVDEALEQIDLSLPGLSNTVAEAARAIGGMAPMAETNQPIAPGAAARTRTYLVDGMDAGGWSREHWGDGGKVRFEAGRLRLDFGTGPEGKFAVSRTAGRLVLRATDTLTIQAEPAAGAGSGLDLALALVVGSDYFESRPVRLKGGIQTVAFLLGEAAFKSEETDWRHRAELPDPVVIGKLTLLIYAAAPGTLYLDDLSVRRAQGVGGGH